MSWIIAIPSYNRLTIIQTKTLTFLKNNNIPNHLIHIFIVEEDLDAYKTIPTDLYGHLIVGVKGLVHQRRFISNYFTEGQHIVSLDDDITNLVFLPDQILPLSDFFNKAFNICVEEKSYIWGFYPIANLFYMNNNVEYSSHLTAICGAAFGFINRPNNTNLVLDITAENGNKEDVENTILHWILDKKIIRFNRIGILTKYYNTNGGMGTRTDRMEPSKTNTILLTQKYPDITKIKIRKNGMYEIVLKDKSVFGRIRK